MDTTHTDTTDMTPILDMTRVGAIGINTTVLSTKTIGVEIQQEALGVLEVLGATITAAPVPAIATTTAIQTPAEEVTIPRFLLLHPLLAAAQAQVGAAALLHQEVLGPITGLLALEVLVARVVQVAQATPVQAHLDLAPLQVVHSLALAQEEDNFPSTDS